MLKRGFDIIVSATGLIVLSPVLLVIALAIKASSKGPALYKGRRMGFAQKPFFMFKFRTMVINADKIGGPTTSDDDPRVTKIGAFLRKYKLDELPQLINVLKGEMSLVGPRPEVEEVTKHFTKEQRIVFSVRPGITDWASLRFPNEGELVKGAKDPHQAYLEKIWPEKIRLQMKYARERTFSADLKIILRTIRVVLFGHNGKIKI